MLFIHFVFLFRSVKKKNQGGTVEITGKAWWDLRDSLERRGKLVQKVRENLTVTQMEIGTTKSCLIDKKFKILCVWHWRNIDFMFSQMQSD